MMEMIKTAKNPRRKALMYKGFRPWLSLTYCLWLPILPPNCIFDNSAFILYTVIEEHFNTEIYLQYQPILKNAEFFIEERIRPQGGPVLIQKIGVILSE